MKGIDVSIFQGEVDWPSVRNAGIDFALIKCSQGGFTNSSAISPFTDRYFKRNIVGASDAGLLCGAYHLLMGVTVEDVAAEARYVVELLAPYKERITLPVAVDIEDARYRRNTRELNSTLALEFMRIVGEAGYQTMLYTNRDFLQNHYDDEMLGDIPIWFALYRNPRSDENVPQDWANIIFWQWNDGGSVSGIRGAVSQDVSYGEFAEKELGVGSVVRINPSAEYYFSKGPRIPAWVKNDYDYVVAATTYRGRPVVKNGDTCVLLGQKISRRDGKITEGINTWCSVQALTPVEPGSAQRV